MSRNVTVNIFAGVNFANDEAAEIFLEKLPEEYRTYDSREEAGIRDYEVFIVADEAVGFGISVSKYDWNERAKPIDVIEFSDTILKAVNRLRKLFAEHSITDEIKVFMAGDCC